MLKGKLIDGKTQMYEVDWFEPHDQEIEAAVTDVAQVFCWEWPVDHDGVEITDFQVTKKRFSKNIATRTYYSEENKGFPSLMLAESYKIYLGVRNQSRKFIVTFEEEID